MIGVENDHWLSVAVAGASFRPWLWWLVGAGALAYFGRYLLRARRRGSDWAAALLSPAANLLVDIANLVGFTAGLLSPRLGPRERKAG